MKRGTRVFEAVVCAAIVMFTPWTSAAQENDRRAGSFILHKSADKITDEDRSKVVSMGESGAIIWGCMSDGLNVAFMWNRYLIGSNDTIPVQHRFTPKPAATNRWDMSTGNKMGFLPMDQVRPFTAEALQSGTVTLRVIDRDGDTVTDTFKLDGLTEALKWLPCAKSLELQ
jgi:hypothetical protein